jgi:hypothetical protein
VIIVGGTDAVSNEVQGDLEARGYTTDRRAETTRFGTAVAIANLAIDEFGFRDDHVNLARGNDFADALAGGPHGGVDRSPIVLSFPETLPEPTRAFLAGSCATLTDGHIFGGTAAISLAVEAEAENAAQSCDAPNAVVLGDARVAQDRVDASGATDTASAGDVIELVATDTATATDSGFATDTAGATFTVEDADGDTAVIECGAEVVATDDVLAATCEVSADQRTLTITLLETGPVDANGQALLGFPLTITGVDGLNDANGEPITEFDGDVVIDVDEGTTEVLV